MRLPLFTTLFLAATLATAAWGQDTPTTPSANPAPSASMGGELAPEAMIGRTIYDRDNQEVGKLDDVAVDPQTGRISRFMIVPRDGTDGGRKAVAVDMDKVEVMPEQGIRLPTLSRGDIAAMPDAAPGSALSLGGRPPQSDTK